jgi:hypothetical protein
MPEVGPVCLASDDARWVEPGAELLLAGWGQTNYCPFVFRFIFRLQHSNINKKKHHTCTEFIQTENSLTNASEPALPDRHQQFPLSPI